MTLVTAALEYAARGIAIFPVWGVTDEGACACGVRTCGKDAGKHPHALARHGFKDATTDETIIRAWWTEAPDANIGTPTGSWCAVLDVDPRHQGDDTLADLERTYGLLPETAEVLTGGGGRHLYFAPVAGLHGRTGMAPGLDVKAEGGYVLLPPSRHLSGREYCDAIVCPLLETKLAPMPPWLLKLARGGNGHRVRVEPAPFTAPAAIRAGERNATLYRLGRGMRAKGFSLIAITAALDAENQTKCQPPLDAAEMLKLSEQVWQQPDRADFAASRNDPAPDAGAPSAEREAVILSASTIQPERVTWLWPGRLAVGALTNLVGLPDQGKTLAFCDLAARLTTGAPMPPAARQLGGEPQRVLILTLEDSLAHTIVPRLIRAGADLGHVDFIRQVREKDGSLSLFTLATDLDALKGALAREPYALLIVDGIAGYLGDTKTHQDAEVRRVLTPFAELLDRSGVAGLSTMHPPKSISNLAYYAGGSVAFTAIPRVTLGAAPDPEDESESPRRLLLKLKGNLYGAVPTLAYRIAGESPADVPWIDWEPEPVRVNLSDVLDPIRESPEERTSRKACRAFLETYLADGPRHSVDVEAALKDAGFKRRTIERAKQGLVDSVRRGFGGDGGWDWLLKGRQ